jgi:hypothetical protein
LKSVGGISDITAASVMSSTDNGNFTVLLYII